MLNPRSLKLFHLIAEKGSLASASDHFNLSPPAASRMISILEENLGFKLFSREGRNLVLTPNGKKFLLETLPILSNYENITELARDIKSGTTPQLRILATVPSATTWIAPALIPLKAKYPDLMCRIEIVDRMGLQSNVGSLSHDIAIASYPISSSIFLLDAHPLCHFRYEAVFRKDHPLAQASELSASDIAPYPLIALTKGQIGRERMEEFFLAGGVDMEPEFETTSSLVVLSLCKQGLGVSLLPSIYVHGLNDSELISRPINPERWISFGAFTAKSSPSSEVQQEFIANLKDGARQWPGARTDD